MFDSNLVQNDFFYKPEGVRSITTRLVCCICSNLVCRVQAWADWLPGSPAWPGSWRAKHPTGPDSQETKTKSVSGEPGSLGPEGVGAWTTQVFLSHLANQLSAKFVHVIDIQLAKHIYIACTWPDPFQPTACSLGLSATSQRYFSLRMNQPPATSRNQPAVLFSQNKPAPAISHQPTEQAASWFDASQARLRRKPNAP
jgi:hypothetical protein